MVAELIDVDGEWNFDLIYSCFWSTEADAIFSIPLSIHLVPDRLCWHYTKKGVYTVKSGYQVVMDSRSRALSNKGSSVSNNDLVWKTLWRLKLPAGAKVFILRALHGILPCSFNLFQRHLLSSLQLVHGVICMLKPYFMLCGHVLRPKRYGYSLLLSMLLVVAVGVLLSNYFAMQSLS